MSHFTLLLLLIAASVAPATTFASPRDEMLTPEAADADIALAKETLESLHAGYDRYTERAVLDQMWTQLRSDASVGISRGALYYELSRLLAALRCDHTKAELPEDLEAARRSEAIYLPFRYRLFDQRMLVTQVAEGVALAPRDEVLSIDGRPVGELIAAVNAAFPVDGDTDYVKEHSISAFGEFMGPAFEHFMPFIYPIGDSAELRLRRADGTEESVRVERVPFERYASITGERRYSANFADAVRFETLGEDAAYLAVDTFINYREPVPPDSIYGPIFKRLRSEGRDKLIVDLRRNGGGSDDAAWGLFRWLIREPVQPIAEVWTRFDRMPPELRQHLDTWDDRALSPKPRWFEPMDNGYFRLVARRAGAPGGPLKPKRAAFGGKVVMLTSYDNASGVTHLLAALRGVDRAIFIGEPTGGAATGATAGIIAFLTLPESGIRVRIPLQRTVMANAGHLDPRGGIHPDVEALETAEDAFRGADPALAAAKAYLGIASAGE